MMLEESVEKLLAGAKKSPYTLSVYLDTDAGTGLWRDKLYNLRMALDRLAASMEGKAARRAFAEDQERVLAFVRKHKAKGAGLVVFSSAGQKLWWTTSLPVRVANAVRYGSLGSLLTL